MTTTTERRSSSPTWRHLLQGDKLDKLGVRPLNKFDLELECKVCGKRWSPRRTRDGELPKGYWQCPGRCNW